MLIRFHVLFFGMMVLQAVAIFWTSFWNVVVGSLFKVEKLLLMKSIAFSLYSCYDMIYIYLTAVGLTPGGSSTSHLLVKYDRGVRLLALVTIALFMSSLVLIACISFFTFEYCFLSIGCILALHRYNWSMA
jgi:hypothetical protein